MIQFPRRGLLAAAVAGAAPARAQQRPDLRGSGRVVVFDGGGAWGAAQKAAYFDPFQAETGITVVRSPRAPAGRFRTSIEAGAPSYEVADISAALLGPLSRDGLLLPIDYQYFDPADRAAMSPVPATEFGVPDLFYSLVMAWDPRRVRQAPRNWTEFWDVRAFPGERALGAGGFGAGTGSFEVALMADGVPPDKLYPLDLDRVFRSLDRIKPAIVKFWNTGAEPVQMLVDGNAALATAWNGRIADITSQGGQIGTHWNQGILQYDTWVVPKGTVNVTNAMKFIAFATRPDRQAHFSRLITYGPTNSRAQALLPPERATVLPTHPPLVAQQVVQDYDWWGGEAGNGSSNFAVATRMWERWITR